MKNLYLCFFASLVLAASNAFACSPPAKISESECRDLLVNIQFTASSGKLHTWYEGANLFAYCNEQKKFPVGEYCELMALKLEKDFSNIIEEEETGTSCGNQLKASVSVLSKSLIDKCLDFKHTLESSLDLCYQELDGTIGEINECSQQLEKANSTIIDTKSKLNKARKNIRKLKKQLQN